VSFQIFFFFLLSWCTPFLEPSVASLAVLAPDVSQCICCPALFSSLPPPSVENIFVPMFFFSRVLLIIYFQPQDWYTENTRVY